MDYLALVNRVRQEAGISGPDLLSLGGTLSRESGRVKNWVNEEWRAIQTHLPDADFMRADFSFETTATVNTYEATTLSTPITDLRTWKRDSFRAYLTATGFPDEQLLRFRPWEIFRDHYLYGNQRTETGRPVLITVRPNKSLVIGPVPDANYTIVGEYFKRPASLVADTDEPAIDDTYHMLVVWRALRRYALFESATEVLVNANSEISRLMTKLEAEYGQEVTSGPPLA